MYLHSSTCGPAGTAKDLGLCFDMVTSLPAKLMNLADYGIAVGNPADIIVLDGTDAASIVAELAPPLFGIKRGRRSFTRSAPVLNWP